MPTEMGTPALIRAGANGEQMDLLGRVRGTKGVGGRVQPSGPPLLEQLEPRLLLSADLIGTEPLAALGTSLGEQAILVNLDQEDEQVRESDCSLVLTYLASTDEADSSQADMSGGSSLADTEDANPGGQPLDDAVQPAEVDEVATGAFVGMPLGQVEFAIQVAADSDELAAPISNESAGLIVSDQRDSMAGSDGFPIEARGPPQDLCDSLNASETTTCGEEEQPSVLVEAEATSSPVGLIAPELPSVERSVYIGEFTVADSHCDFLAQGTSTEEVEYLLSVEPTAPASTAVIPLDEAGLTSILDEAICRWTASGLVSDAGVFEDVSLVIADLPIGVLGQTENGIISIDVTANGHGWFVDLTPADDSEFFIGDDGRFMARADGPAAGRIDLLTVILHELGHVVGFGHTDILTGDGPDVMSYFINSGVRLLANAPANPFEPGFAIDVPAFLLVDNANLNDVIDELLANTALFDPTDPPTGEVVFISGGGQIPDHITVGTTIGDGIADLQIEDVTLTFSEMVYDFGSASWTGWVKVEATSATLFPGLLDIEVNDDDDPYLFAVVGFINLAVDNDDSYLGLDDLDVDMLGWPSFLNVVIADLALNFEDFRGNDNLNSLQLSVELDGFDTGNDTINALLEADNPLFGLNIQGFASAELAIDEIEDALAGSSGDLPAIMKAALATAMATNLTGLGGTVSGKLFGVGSLTATFIYNTVTYDPDGTDPLPERSAVYIAIQGALSLGPAIAGDGGDGGFASFNIAFAISELGPLQFFASIDAPIMLEPVTGLAISSMRLGVMFNTTIEDLQTDEDFDATGATVTPNGTGYLVTLTVPDHDLEVGDDFRILGNDNYNGDFTALTVNGDEVTYEVESNPGSSFGSAKIMRLTIRDPLDLLDEGLQSGVAPPGDIFAWRDQLDGRVRNQLEAGGDIWARLFGEVVFGGGASLSFDPRIPDWLLSFDVDFLLGLGLDFDEPVLQILLNGKMSLLDGLVTFNNTRLYADLSDLFSGSGRFLYLQTQGDNPLTDPLLVYRGWVSFEALGGPFVGSGVLNALVTDTTASGYWTAELGLTLDNPSDEYSIGDYAAIFDSNPDTTFDGIYEVIDVDDTANTITIKINCDLDGEDGCSDEEITATNPGTWELDSSPKVSNKDDLGIGFRISIGGGIDLNIPIDVTTLTLEGELTVEFWVPGPTAEEDLRIELSFTAELSETHVGPIATAACMFVVALDFDAPADEFIIIYGAARLTTEFDFLEYVGLFMDASGFLRINSSNQDRSITLPLPDEATVDLPANSFALRLEGSIDFRIDFNFNGTFAESESVFEIAGIFVLEFSTGGFNAAIFSIGTTGIQAAVLRLGPKGSPFIEFEVFAFLAIRGDGFAAHLAMSAEAALPLDLASINAMAAFIVNTTGRDVVFEIPGGGADPNRPTGLSLTIPGAAPANPSGILAGPGPGGQPGLSLQDLIDGDTSWGQQSTPGAYGVVFLAGSLDLLSLLGLHVSGYILLSEEVMSLELNFYAGLNFLNLVSAQTHGTVFFSSQGEFEVVVEGYAQLGPDWLNVHGKAYLWISYLDSDGRGSEGDGNRILNVTGLLEVGAVILGVDFGDFTLGVSYNSDSGDITVSVGVWVPYIAKKCWSTFLGRICIYYPSFHKKYYTFTVGNLRLTPPYIPPPPVVLGQVNNEGILILNVGPKAADRNLMVDEPDEGVLIEHLSGNAVDGEQIRITMFGHSETFDNVLGIRIPDMGEGDDSVDVYYGVCVPVEVHFGADRDSLTCAGPGMVVAYGDEGDDYLEGGSGNDRLFGGAGNDILDGKAGQDWIEGYGDDDPIDEETDDADVLIGGADGDVLKGGPGFDRIAGDLAEFMGDETTSVLETIASALGGNDIIEGGEGPDMIFGGSGNDQIEGGLGDDTLVGDDGTVTLSAPQEDGISISFTLTVLDFSGNDIIYGGDGDDHIYGAAGEDKILGGRGGDFLYGDNSESGSASSGPGRDIIIGDDGEIIYSGDEFSFNAVTSILAFGTIGGSDTIEGNEGNDVILGGAGADASLQGNAGDDILLGDNGQVTLSNGNLVKVEGYGDGGVDFIYGGGDSDVIMGGCQGDIIEGGPDNDILIGDAGIVDGTRVVASVGTGDGSDTIYGQEGEDKILGGGGNDYLYGFEEDSNDSGQQRDIIIGDGGTITYGNRFDFGSVSVIVADSTVGGNDTIQGNDGDDIILAGVGSDTDVQGNTGNDIMLGDNGTVNVTGGALASVSTEGQSAGGADRLWGGDGNDIIIGGPSGDEIYGEQDGDVLVGDNGTIAETAVESVAEGSDGADTIYGQEGEDKILGGGGGDFLYGDKNSESEDLSLKRDIIIGDAGSIAYSGGRFSFGDVTTVSASGATGGSDVVEGNDGNDLILGGGAGDLSLNGNAGDDILIGDGGSIHLNAGLAEIITNSGESSGGVDEIRGDSGEDIILGGAAGDAIYGGSEGDILIGDNGTIQLSGGQVSTIDTVGESHGGADVIEGNEAGDIILGGPNGSSDTIWGNEDDDVIMGDNGLLDFGLDGDLTTLDLIRSALDGIGGHDVLFGNAGSDVVMGGTGGDEIYGDDGDDILMGDNGEISLLSAGIQAGMFTVQGGIIRRISTIDQTESTGGDDLVMGGGGRDIIFGGVNNGGVDELYGDFDLPDPRDAEDVIVGDNGIAEFMATGVLSEVRTKDPELGGEDHIIAGNARDVVIAGSGDDLADAGGDDEANDVVLGDNGRMTFGGTESFDPGEEYSTVSFNFNSGAWSADVSGVAGAPGAAAGNWNNLTGSDHTIYGDESGEIVYSDDGCIAPGVQVEWGSNLDSADPGNVFLALHDQISPGDNEDLRLFEGYLVAGASKTLGVNIHGLAGHFASYDVYVYLDADDSSSHSQASVRCIRDGNTAFYVNDPDGNTFAGTYVQVSSIDPLASQIGNYVVFSSLTGDIAAIRISSWDVSSNWSSNRPAIAGIQVVGRRYPIDRVETLNPEFGGDDTLITGCGPDLVLGGSGNDYIAAFGDAVKGRTDQDVVAGDNARATFMLDELWEIHCTSPEIGGDDVVLTGNGEDLVLGGPGSDQINSGVQGPFDNGSVKVISFNFNSGVAEGKVTGVAGVVQAGNWNNLSGANWSTFGDRSTELIYFDNGSIAKGVTIKRQGGLAAFLSGRDDVDSHDQIKNPGTQNERLFEGYLCGSPGTGVSLSLTGLSVFGSAYDLYVYVDADDSHCGSGDSVYRISDGTTCLYLSDPAGHTFLGEFVEASATQLQDARPGNYAVFRDLTSSTVEIRVDSVRSRSEDNWPNPVISAIQIVSGRDRSCIEVGGDTDKDAVLGDSGVAYRFGGSNVDLRSTQLRAGGNDTICSGDDTDLVIGGAGDDEIVGEDGHDLVLGDNGRLILFAGRVVGLDFTAFNADDCLTDSQPYHIAGIQLLDDGFGGDDVLTGGMGDDLLYGQFGNDHYVFAGQGLGRDKLVEAGYGDWSDRPNDSHDLIDLSAFLSKASLDLSEPLTQVINGDMFDGDINLTLTLFSGTAFEDVIATAYADVIDGNIRDNTLDGQKGNDTLRGSFGNDTLLGKEGDDNLVGDLGDDILVGGDGKDSLKGGLGRNIQIGGLGADKLKSIGGGDILIGGYTSFDANVSTLSAIREIWSSGASCASRMNLIRSLYLEAKVTVFDDNVKDTLMGTWWPLNWFFADHDGRDGDDDSLKGSWIPTMLERL